MVFMNVVIYLYGVDDVVIYLYGVDECGYISLWC